MLRKNKMEKGLKCTSPIGNSAKNPHPPCLYNVLCIHLWAPKIPFTSICGLQYTLYLTLVTMFVLHAVIKNKI